jgi:hypothetical protein
LFRVLRVKLQIQFSLIDVMLMGLKLSPSSTNKYITGTLNKGANGGKRVVFLGWNMGKGKGRGRREGKEWERRGRGRGRGKEGKEGERRGR